MSHQAHALQDPLSIISRNGAALLSNLKGEKVARASCVQMYSGEEKAKQGDPNKHY
jgi:hypothetical protein